MALKFKLKVLAQNRSFDYPITSLFLNLRPTGVRRVPGLTFLKKELASLEKSVPFRSEEKKILDADLRYLKRSVAQASQATATGLAMFTSAKKRLYANLFWSIASESDLQIPNSLVRDSRPNLYPLALLNDRLEDFLLLVIDLQKAELFEVDGGMIVRKWTTSFEPPRYTRGKGKLGLSRPRVSARGHQYLERYVKTVAGKAVDWARAAQTKSVIIGADAIVGPAMSKEIARLAGDLSVKVNPIDAKLPEHRKLALGISAFRKKEREMSHGRVSELLFPGRKRTVLGVKPVLEFLRTQKKGRILVLDEAFHRAVPICARCSVWAPADGTCPTCSGPVREAVLENELVCLAISFGVEVEFVKDSELLARKGGIGLLL